MLSKLLPLVLSLGLAGTASAQFAIDFNAGANRSNLRQTKTSVRKTIALPEYRDLNGYFIGVTPSYRFGEQFRALFGVQYSVKGYSSPAIPGGPDVNVRLGYVDFIPEVEWRPVPVIGLSLGGYLGLNTSERYGSRDNPFNNVDLYATTDLGAIATVRVYHKDFFAMARYAHGLADLSEIPFTDTNGTLVGDTRQEMRNLQVGLGYRLSLSRG